MLKWYLMETTHTWVYDDGGRTEAGFRGEAGDCGVRAIAIATNLPYRTVYDAVNLVATDERPRRGKRSNSRTGLWPSTVGTFLKAHGYQWVPTMTIGSGCRVHLRADELPPGRLVARCSRHYVAVIDGVIHDTYDSTRDGTRCVYGYWKADR